MLLPETSMLTSCPSSTRPRSTPTYSAVSTHRAATFCCSMMLLHSVLLSSASRHATASSEIVQRR